MSLTWDEEVELVKNEGYTEDEIGQRVPVQKKKKVFCCRIPVTRNEFYKARQNDIEVSEMLVVHPYEYSGEKTVIFRGKELDVIRTYEKNQEECELTCTERIGKRSV